jgi:hypothetical protein
MAEATDLRNNALPYPVYGAPFGVVFPLLDADGDPISPSSPDSEISKNGDSFADCTNEATEIATSSGVCYLLLTGTELTADVVGVRSQSTGAKTTVLTLYPRKLVTIRSGTSASLGSLTNAIVLDSGASDQDDFYNGMLCLATIDGNVEARVISDYVGSTKTASVVPDWNVAPDNNDTFEIKLPEGVQVNQANVTHLGGSTQSATDLKDFADDGYDPSTNKITGVVLTDTVTTYTGNTPQTGDSFTRIGATGSGLTTLALQSSVDDLPTNAELNTALGTADDAVLAAIAALNNLSAAQVNAEVDTALSDYDGPTNAELATALGTADDAILAAIAALNNLSSAQAQTAVTSALTAALTEGYRGTGATGSVRDLLYEIIAHLGESSISSTTKTINKLDGTTPAKTYTLDSATTPTAITETT